MLKENFTPKVQELMDMHNQNDPSRFWGSREMFILFGAIFCIAALFFYWAKYIRISKRKSSRAFSSSRKPDRLLRESRDRQGKVRRRRWTKRNPTLAETGGLPPPKNIPAPD